MEGVAQEGSAKRCVTSLMLPFRRPTADPLSLSPGSYTQNPTGAFDEAMFSVVWKPVVSALSYAFANFQDDHMVQRAIGGFNHCASLAARFNMPEVFDYLLFSLSRVSGLIQPSNASQDVGNFPVVEVEGQKITLSPLAVHFGENVKAQLAAVVLFTIANSNGAFIRQGWMQVFEIYVTLFIHSLLPPSMLMMEDFLFGESAIPLKPKTAPTPREERRGDGGLLSTLSSYLLSPYGAGGEIAATNFNDDDVEQTLSTIDTIASCRIDELYSHILFVSCFSSSFFETCLTNFSLPAAISKAKPSSLPSKSSPTSSNVSRSNASAPSPVPARVRPPTRLRLASSRGRGFSCRMIRRRCCCLRLRRALWRGVRSRWRSSGAFPLVLLPHLPPF